jgi:hypothetical protein
VILNSGQKLESPFKGYHHIREEAEADFIRLSQQHNAINHIHHRTESPSKGSATNHAIVNNNNYLVKLKGLN